MNNTLQKRFVIAIREMMTRTIRETTYRPSLFQQMIRKRGELDASLALVRTSKPSQGFTTLWELKRLDLTIEAVVIRPEFADLFAPDDVETAERRLAMYGYEVG